MPQRDELVEQLAASIISNTSLGEQLQVKGCIAEIVGELSKAAKATHLLFLLR